MFLKHKIKVNLLYITFTAICVTACQAVHVPNDQATEDKLLIGIQEPIEQKQQIYSSSDLSDVQPMHLSANQHLSNQIYLEKMILEVASKPEFCSSGINQKCLKVRSIEYHNGQAKVISDWRLIKQSINGYTHDPETKTILQVKKVITNPVDVKGKQLSYILDKVLHTEVVDTH